MGELTIISLGAGVQSSTMALMCAVGEIKPMPEFAVFADTQAEPDGVYSWLDWLEKQLPFPVHRVSKGSLTEASTRQRRSQKSGNLYLKSSIPAFLKAPDGKMGISNRQCTSDYKITPIHQFIRKHREKKQVIQMMGISYDEIIRMKPSRKKYITHTYPLIDLKMTRQDCLDWMNLKGYPMPPRSACVYCPYHSNKEWERIKVETPAEFQKAVQYEKDLQAAAVGTILRGTPFLHRSGKPLNEIIFVDYDADKRGQVTNESKQGDFFGAECEGMCGV